MFDEIAARRRAEITCHWMTDPVRREAAIDREVEMMAKAHRTASIVNAVKAGEVTKEEGWQHLVDLHGDTYAAYWWNRIGLPVKLHGEWVPQTELAAWAATLEVVRDRKMIRVYDNGVQVGKAGGNRAERAAAVIVDVTSHPVNETRRVEVSCRQTVDSARSVAAKSPRAAVIVVPC